MKINRYITAQIIKQKLLNKKLNNFKSLIQEIKRSLIILFKFLKKNKPILIVTEPTIEQLKHPLINYYTTTWIPGTLTNARKIRSYAEEKIPYLPSLVLILKLDNDTTEIILKEAYKLQIPTISLAQNEQISNIINYKITIKYLDNNFLNFYNKLLKKTYDNFMLRNYLQYTKQLLSNSNSKSYLKKR